MVNVEIRGLVKKYADHLAVDHLDLSIPSGAFVTFLGPSGCGKTTTLRSIAGLEDVDGGRITVGDQTFVDAERAVHVPPERRRVGMVFQSYALWPHMTVEQNLVYPLRRRHWDKSLIAPEVERFLDLVNLTAQRGRSVAALSGGQQQRVALARAMVGNPVLTLFDEPLSNLDVKLRDRMRTEIRRLHDSIGMTSIYVTHDQDEAFTLSDLIVVMNEGRVQQIGSPQDVYFRPANAFVADFVGYKNCIPVNVLSGTDGRARVSFVNGTELDVDVDVAVPGRPLSAFARTDAVSFVSSPGCVQAGVGRVTDVTYVGDAYELHVESEAGTFQGRHPALHGQVRPFDVGAVVPVFLELQKTAFIASDVEVPTPEIDWNSAHSDPTSPVATAKIAGSR